MKQGTSGHASIHVDAPPEKVWAAVTDVSRMGEWSPETLKGEWLDGATGPVVGGRFKGSNKRGFLRWSTTADVVAADDAHEFAFAVGGATKWTYKFASEDGGTRLEESFELLKDLAWYYDVVERYLMRIKDRRADLEAAMQTTLERIKRAVEGSAT